jgi:hypothetical protein
MIQNVTNVISWLELNKLDWFTVSTTKDDNSKVFDSIETESFEDRKNRFIETMRLSHGGRYVIKAKANKTAGRGVFMEEFANIESGQPAQVAGIGSVPPSENMVTVDELEKRITDAIARDRQARELEDLRAELKEARAELKENDSAINRIIKNAEPIIGLAISRIMPQGAQMGIAGTNNTIPVDGIVEKQNEVSEEEIDALSARIELAVAKWGTADPDFIEVMEFIADFASNGSTISPFPGINLDYKSIKGMLK